MSIRLHIDGIHQQLHHRFIYRQISPYIIHLRLFRRQRYKLEVLRIIPLVGVQDTSLPLGVAVEENVCLAVELEVVVAL